MGFSYDHLSYDLLIYTHKEIQFLADKKFEKRYAYYGWHTWVGLSQLAMT